jgi:asparagine synthase (glutamine-hydrolysing)
MCGITGFLTDAGRFDAPALRSIAQRMSDTLRHRGPDDAGVWVDPAVGAALGHRRLSIQDLSAAGKQPMVSACGRYIITYNGEVYNFPALRAELEARGQSFRGHSDTEVILAAVVEWGLAKTLERLQGMFAFGLWDRQERTLTLVRDRVGKKPLYYGWCGKTLLFGSELKALQAHPDFDAEIDRDALGLFMQYSWIPAPYSIFRSIRKLPPGCFLTLATEGNRGAQVPQAYWSARSVAERGEQQPFSGTIDQAADALDALLRDATGSRMIADVGLGALLSGGIDSTTVVALMQALSPQPVKTFTIGFEDPKYNEAEHAKAIAGHLGTEHTELYVTARETLDVIPSLPTMYDEPMADVSAIPTFVVSQLARRNVTVALSGDGGDELFGGYNRYFSTLKQWNQWRSRPLPLRRGTATALRWLSHQGWEWFGQTDAASPAVRSRKTPFAKLEKKAKRLPARDPVDLFARVSAYCETPGELVLGAKPVPTAFTEYQAQARLAEDLQSMMYLDFVGFMVDDILVKVDRASMAVSLEVRSPILDHRVVEFAWSLPIGLRIGPGGGKYVLRKVLERYVPRALTERPKQGFNVPVREWLRGPLHDWAEALLEPRRLEEQGLLDAAAVRRMWQQHRSGWGDRKNVVWSILMFQAWYEVWGSSATGSRELDIPAIAPAIA